MTFSHWLKDRLRWLIPCLSISPPLLKFSFPFIGLLFSIFENDPPPFTFHNSQLFNPGLFFCLFDLSFFSLYLPDRDRFQLGTLSHSLNTKATGYQELSDWPAVAPDQSVRNVEVIEPVRNPPSFYTSYSSFTSNVSNSNSKLFIASSLPVSLRSDKCIILKNTDKATHWFPNVLTLKSWVIVQNVNFVILCLASVWLILLWFIELQQFVDPQKQFW